MKEPIQHFFETYGFDPELIKISALGERYAAVMLKNGNMGVCAVLQNEIKIRPEDIKKPDLNRPDHRIILNAYYNALLNYENNDYQQADIFEKLDFRKYNSIVMIGYFRTLVKKFETEKIPLFIFDKAEDDEILTCMKDQKMFLEKADCVILSGTTIFNSTFLDITESTKKDADIFLLGPSNILHNDMFRYRNIKIVFGSVFQQNDMEVIEIINNGGGTPDFLHRLNKVYITQNIF